MFLIWRTSAPNYKKKSTALKLYCDCDCSCMAVEWVLAEEIFSAEVERVQKYSTQVKVPLHY